MSIEVKMSPTFARYANNQRIATVNGSTVGECLDDLIKQFPDLKSRLFDKNGQLHRHLDVFVNHISTYPELLDKRVNEGDKIQLLIHITGG